MGEREKKEIEKRLRAYRKEYKQVKERIQKIDFICQGSLIERRLPCGNPNCRCHKDPKKRHGPYYQLSWKEKRKTISHFLSPELAPLYREWIENRRLLLSIVEEMLAISRKAGDHLRTTENHKRKTSKKSKDPRKKTT